MAGIPGNPGRRSRTTTIRTFPSTGTAAATTVNRGINKPPARRVTAQAVPGLPDQLLRILNEMQEDIDQALEGVFSNPHSTPSILRNITLTAGQSKTYFHDLARPYTGWSVRRLYAGSQHTISEDSLPAGQTNDKAIQLKNVGPATVTFDVEVTGD